jgi:hypothetical protein
LVFAPKGLTEPGLLPGGATPHGVLENLLGSAVPAFIVTALVSGKAGVRDLTRRSGEAIFRDASARPQHLSRRPHRLRVASDFRRSHSCPSWFARSRSWVGSSAVVARACGRRLRRTVPRVSCQPSLEGSAQQAPSRFSNTCNTWTTSRAAFITPLHLLGGQESGRILVIRMSVWFW